MAFDVTGARGCGGSDARAEVRPNCHFTQDERTSVEGHATTRCTAAYEAGQTSPRYEAEFDAMPVLEPRDRSASGVEQAARQLRDDRDFGAGGHRAGSGRGRAPRSISGAFPAVARVGVDRRGSGR